MTSRMRKCGLFIFYLGKTQLLSASAIACVLSHFSRVQLFWDPMDCSLPGFSVHGDSSGESTGVGLPFSFPALTIIVLLKCPLETKSSYLPCSCGYFYLDM